MGASVEEVELVMRISYKDSLAQIDSNVMLGSMTCRSNSITMLVQIKSEIVSQSYPMLWVSWRYVSSVCLYVVRMSL